MGSLRAAHQAKAGRWRLGVAACCSLALVLMLAAIATSPVWLRSGLGVGGLMLLGAGGGLLVAHLLLDTRRPPPGG